MTAADRKAPKFTFKEQEAALCEADLILEQAQMPSPILMGLTLKTMLIDEGLDCGEKGIELGLMSNWLPPTDPQLGDHRHFLRAFADAKDFKWEAGIITFIARSGVPVTIYIVPKGRQFFEHLDAFPLYQYVFDHRFTPDGDLIIAPGDFSMPNPATSYLATLGTMTTKIQPEKLAMHYMEKKEAVNLHG